MDIRHQRQMQENRVANRRLQLELTRGLQKWQALDVAGGAAYLGDCDVNAVAMERADGVLDLIGDMRDDLDGAAKVSAGAFAGDDIAVDPSGGVVAGTGTANSGDALVMPQIEIGLGAVVSHKDLAVLVRTHGAGIDIEIRVQLLHGDAVAALLQQECQCRPGDAFAEAGDHAAGDEDVFGSHMYAQYARSLDCSM